MHTSKRQLLLTASAQGLGLSGLSGIARAHGDQDHAKKAGPVRKEQKDWGIAGEARAAKRTIEVRMGDDMRFTPDRIDVRRGETIRFRAQNTGKVMHEFVIGTKAENARHAELMIKFPNMEHDEPYMAHVPPGKTGEIVWTFNRAGTFEFACLIAGHYSAGMVGTINVSAA
ncbi:MAG: plastocyanin/azurin family copper-binding protein [Piscinibacter sp.]